MKKKLKKIWILISLMKSISDFYYLNTFLHLKNKFKEINFFVNRFLEIIIQDMLNLELMTALKNMKKLLTKIKILLIIEKIK